MWQEIRNWSSRKKFHHNVYTSKQKFSTIDYPGMRENLLPTAYNRIDRLEMDKKRDQECNDSKYLGLKLPKIVISNFCYILTAKIGPFSFNIFTFLNEI